MYLFDSHCHIDVDDFAADRDEVLQNCQKVGIIGLLVPAIISETWSKLLSICNDPLLYPAVGLHPMFLDKHKDEDLIKLRKLLEQYKPVAIGEIGLDFYIKDVDPSRQQRFFAAQLEIAQDHALPVILHVRKAHDQVLKSLKAISVVGGFVHAFNGSMQQAQQYMDLGFKLGFGGTMTYTNAHKIHALARNLPLDAMVLETDAPDMVVSSHQGERNSPEYLPLCLQALANIRQEDEETIATMTTNNAKEILRLA